jgi:hypothetical protein
MKFPIFCAKKMDFNKGSLRSASEEKCHFRFIGAVSDDNTGAVSNSEEKQFSPLAYTGLVQKIVFSLIPGY